ncbi:MAG TPA: hypothetical protein VLA34_00925, partial [Candidatus Krumholzibacterium sp.]|nr:hypothetical protein [Candidatus Krumholzibacterium sp.]
MDRGLIIRGAIAVLTVFVVMAIIPAGCPAEGMDRKPYTPADLYKLKRVSDQQLSPDGRWIAFVVSVTDYDENKSNSDIWILSSKGGEPKRLTNSPKGDSHPRWSPDGKKIAFLSSRGGSTQAWVIPVTGGEAEQVTDFPGGIGELEWMPDGGGFIFTGRTYSDCPDLDCVTERDEAKEERKVSAIVHRELMYRHWDTYADGKAQHLFR